jgi:hypothetical protein
MMEREKKATGNEVPKASPASQLNSHQKAGVWRILQTPNCLHAHVVGAGKTFIVIGELSEEIPHSSAPGKVAEILLLGGCVIFLTYGHARSTFTADCWRCKSSARTN